MGYLLAERLDALRLSPGQPISHTASPLPQTAVTSSAHCGAGHGSHAKLWADRTRSLQSRSAERSVRYRIQHPAPGINWTNQIKDIFLLGLGSDYTVPSSLLELHRNGLGLPLDLAVVKQPELSESRQVQLAVFDLGHRPVLRIGDTAVFLAFDELGRVDVSPPFLERIEEAFVSFVHPYRNILPDLTAHFGQRGVTADVFDDVGVLV